MEHLIVAFDDSPAAHSAAQWAFGLAATHDARVTLVYLTAPVRSRRPRRTARVRDAAVEQAQLTRPQPQRRRRRVGYVDLPGDPVDAMDLADVVDADLIVIGTDERRAATVHALAHELLDGGASVAVDPTGMQPPDLDTTWVVAVDGSSHDRGPVVVHPGTRCTTPPASRPCSPPSPRPTRSPIPPSRHGPPGSSTPVARSTTSDPVAATPP